MIATASASSFARRNSQAAVRAIDFAAADYGKTLNSLHEERIRILRVHEAILASHPVLKADGSLARCRDDVDSIGDSPEAWAHYGRVEAAIATADGCPARAAQVACNAAAAELVRVAGVYVPGFRDVPSHRVRAAADALFAHYADRSR